MTWTDDGLLRADPPWFGRIEVDPRVCVPGDAVVLSWTASGAYEVTVRGQGAFPATASTVVEPTGSGSYVLVASGPGGNTVARSPRVLVVEAPVITEVPLPTLRLPRPTGTVVSGGPATARVSGVVSGSIWPASPFAGWRRERPPTFAWARAATELIRTDRLTFPRASGLLTRRARLRIRFGFPWRSR